MIEKIFENTKCISCGKETPVIFIIKDILGEPLYKISLCRDCSEKFAEDKIRRLKEKNEIKIAEIITLKKKVKQMNIKSSNHKKVIREMHQCNKDFI